MFTALDVELYPRDCDVVEIPHHNLNIYRVFKNGSSTLLQIAEKNQYKIFQNEKIYQLKSVDMLLRDPRQRYVAGVDMFVKIIKKDNPHLDLKTCIWFANRYCFLNRHYVTQFHWLLNLVRFVNPDCQIRFHDFSLLPTITDRNDKINRDPLDSETISIIESYLPQKEFWFLLDDILRGLQGQSLTWKEIKKIFCDHPADPLKEFTTSMEICDVLR
jgi:hypothetical protein